MRPEQPSNPPASPPATDPQWSRGLDAPGTAESPWYSLDELPQLFNVLAGHMSLVGPGPPLPEEVALYSEQVARKLLLKPGFTGLWQVGGRSDLTWDESVRLELRYVENFSFLLDLQILARTFNAILRGDGAY